MTSPALTLTEGGAPQTVELTGSEYRAFQQLGLVTVTPTLDAGRYEVTAGRKVGAVTVGSVNSSSVPRSPT